MTVAELSTPRAYDSALDRGIRSRHPIAASDRGIRLRHPIAASDRGIRFGRPVAASDRALLSVGVLTEKSDLPSMGQEAETEGGRTSAGEPAALGIRRPPPSSGVPSCTLPGGSAARPRSDFEEEGEHI
jgi:hypothetical protein